MLALGEVQTFQKCLQGGVPLYGYTLCRRKSLENVAAPDEECSSLYKSSDLNALCIQGMLIIVSISCQYI